MQRLWIALALTLAVVGPSSGQGLDDLTIQLHGYATQSELYTDRNSWNTTDSSNGSAAWSGVVVNLSAQPEPPRSWNLASERHHRPGAIGYVCRNTPHEGFNVLAVR